MLLQIFTFLCWSLPHIIALQGISINFSVNYFIHRNVKFVCLVTNSEHLMYSHEFAKAAFSHSISFTKVVIDDIPPELTGIGDCLKQTHSSIGIFIHSGLAAFEGVINFVTCQFRIGIAGMQNCNLVKNIFVMPCLITAAEKASEHSAFDSNHVWLLIDEGNMLTDIKNNPRFATEVITNDTDSALKDKVFLDTKLFQNLNLSVDADIHIGNVEKTGQYDVYEVFNFGKVQGGKVIINKVASWDANKGWDSKFDVYRIYNRWNFNQLSMRVIVVFTPPPKEFYPEMIIGEESTHGVAAITKTGTTIIHTIAEIHNIRLKYTFTDRWIGDFDANSSRVASNSLYFREQDITPVIRAHKTIAEKLDLVYPGITSIETRYYYRIPTSGPGKFENQFIRPLTAYSWLCVAVVISLCAVVLFVSAKLEQRPWLGQYALFTVIASFCQQSFEDRGDMEIRRESSARKLTLLVTGTSCLLVYNYYTSSVVSWLLNGPPPSINSLQELLDSPLELIYEDIGYTRSWLQSSDYYFDKSNMKVEDDLRQKKVFNKKKGDPLLVVVEDGIEMVKDGGYAYHTEVNSANLFISRKFTQNELCELGSLQSMEKSILMPAVQKNSPYKEFFVWSILRLTERGIVSCIQQRTSSISVRCEGSSPRALTLGGAAPAFIILALGYLLATVILLFERMMKKVELSKEEK